MPVGVKWSREQLEALPGLCLHDLMLLPIERLRALLRPASKAAATAAPSSDGDVQALKLLFEEITTRLRYLHDVGIGYLTLDRQSRTLSGGEVQRINLTTALGTSLVNTLFVLDEPSIGLHPRDMNRITEAMLRLRDAGNTLVVVEHDPAVMLAADRVIDMGPGPGVRGGQIVFDGSTDAAARRRHADRRSTWAGASRSAWASARMVSDEHAAPHPRRRARAQPARTSRSSCRCARLVCVTGVSGSGKSTLIQDVLAPALMRHFGKATETPGAHDRLLGADHLSDVVFVDQSPIGKTARSNPASYVGAWDAIREIFATAALVAAARLHRLEVQLQQRRRALPDLRRLGLRARGDAVPVRRLPALPRLRRQALPARDPRGDDRARRARSCNVADVLDLTVAEAAALFANDREVLRVLQPIVDVGLDYVKLGQPVPTLQRRRGAAPQARRLPGRGGQERQRQQAAAGAQGHAVPVRRADHRPALRRHRAPDARAAQAARRRPFAGRDRAQPRRDPRQRLADRPRPRRRRGRRPGGGGGHAGAGAREPRLAHRRRAARLRTGRRPRRLQGGRTRGALATRRARSRRPAATRSRSSMRASTT